MSYPFHVCLISEKQYSQENEIGYVTTFLNDDRSSLSLKTHHCLVCGFKGKDPFGEQFLKDKEKEDEQHKQDYLEWHSSLTEDQKYNLENVWVPWGSHEGCVKSEIGSTNDQNGYLFSSYSANNLYNLSVFVKFCPFCGKEGKDPYGQEFLDHVNERKAFYLKVYNDAKKSNQEDKNDR